MNIISDIQNAFLPELIIFSFIIINIILALFPRKNSYKISKIINTAAIMFSGMSMFFIRINPAFYAFNNSFTSNIFTTAFKIMILISALFVILSSNNLIREKRNKSFEFFAVFLSGILSGFSLVSSNDFISAFLSIELLSVCCYFLCGFRNNHKSKEAALKYLITAAGSSAFFLLGISYIYGLSGNINLAEINDIFALTGINAMFVISSLFIIFALMFKFGAIPFNNWITDVYEGSSYSVCAYLSLIPKIAAFGFVSRLFVFIFSFSPILQIITACIALYTIVYASIGAIKQTNIKRIYAYSSVIHSGFILLALSLADVYALSGVIFYIFTYIFMNIGIWTASIIYTTEYQTDDINDYKGLFYKRPCFATALAICLISLAGLPVTGGFIAKLYLFSALLRADFIYLIILFIAMIAAVISLFVYFKIIGLLFEYPDNVITITNKKILPKIILYLCAVITVLIGIFPNEIIELARIAAYYM